MRFAATFVATNLALVALAAPASADDLKGEWARGDGLVRSRIAPCGASICATNTWTKNPQGDEKVGDRLVMDMHETSHDHWTGSAFDPQRNRTYSMQLSVEGDRMTTRGCVLGGLLCRSVDWTRVGP